MRFRMRFVSVVSAAAVLAGLTGIWAFPAHSKEASQSERAGSSQSEREFRLFERLSHQFEQGLPVTEAEKQEYLALESRYGDLRGRDGLDNQGGPDAFQYIFMDNVPPDNVPYEWIELRGDPEATWLGGLTHFTSVDDGYSKRRLPIGFPFPFYGAVYDCVRVATNGFLQFTTTATTYINACLPSTVVAGPMIAVFWDDLHLVYGGRTDSVVVGYRSFGDYFVVEFDQIGFFTTGCQNVPLKFEAVLYPNGNIKLQYNSIPVPTACVNSQTIGIQQAGAVGSAALNYVCNLTGIQPADGRAILFGRPDGIPNPVTNLTGQYLAPDVVLNWNDPTQDTQGNPITPTNIQVWLGPADTGTLLATVNPGVQTYAHLNAPSGHLTYTVRPFNNPYYGAVASVPLTVGTPGYTNNFESNNGQWVPTPATGGWEWGIPWGVSGLTPHSGLNVWGTIVAGNYTDNACWKLDLNLGLVVTSEVATVEFWHWFYSQASYDGCNFKVSVDNGANWTVLTPTSGGYSTTALLVTTCMTGQPAWAGLTPRAWQRCVIPIGQYVGQVPIFRFEFSSNASTSTYPGFYFDDFELWGVSGGQGGIPTACANLAGDYFEPDVVLTWTDPTLDSQGNPLSIDSVQIWLGSAGSGTRLGSVSRGVQTFTHLGAPIGFQTYSVRPCHGTFFGPPVSVTLMVGNPAYLNNFNTNDGGWTTPMIGGWSWGAPTNPSAPTPHSAQNYWGTGLMAGYPASACWQLDLDSGLVVTSPTATIEFWYWFDTELTYDGCNLKASVDNGATWTVLTPSQGAYTVAAAMPANLCMAGQPMWSGHAQPFWQQAVVPIGQFLGQVPIFRFEFGVDAFASNYAGFFFDDMVIWGASQQAGIPLHCTNLAGTYAAPNVTLTWTDPTMDTHGNPLTIDSVQVWMGGAGSGTFLGSVIAGAQTFTHPNPPAGTITYTVRAFRNPYYGAPVSTSVIGPAPVYPNDFESDNGGWVPDPPTGGWQWGVPTYASGPTAHSGTKVWGTVLASTYPVNACYKLTLARNLSVTSAEASIEFWRWWDTEASYDGCNFKVSIDSGATWTTVEPTGGYGGTTNTSNACIPSEAAWTGHTGGTWTLVTIPLGQFVGQIPWFRITFSSDASINYAGFYFDDMNISGIGDTGAVPQRPTNLAGNYAAGNVTLTWTDPNQDIHSQPMTPDSLQIWLGSTSTGTRLGSVGSNVQTYTHVNAPIGIQTYRVRAYNDGFPGAAAATSVTVGNPSYVNDFELDNGGWVPDPPTDGWEWGTPTLPAGLAAHSGTKVWGTVLNGNYVSNACYLLTLTPGLTVQSPTATVEFWYWYDTEPTWDGCTFQVSTDEGANWNVGRPLTGYPDSMIVSTSRPCNSGLPAWGNHNGSQWAHAEIPLGQWVGFVPQFRFRFGSDNISGVYPGFFFDDMLIWGLRPPSSITGTVRAFLTSQTIAGARVWATDSPDTAITDSFGFYELGIDPGTYFVTVDHRHFCATAFADVVVVSGQQTTRDAVLRRPQAQITRTSITLLSLPGVDVADTFLISNSGGQCPLDFAIADTSEWLTVDPQSGTVDPNQSVTITVSADAPEIVGDYASSLLVTYNAVGTPSVIRVDLSIADAAAELGVIPTEFALYQNFPNPFNAQTSLRFDVPQQSRVQITVYNIMGQEVARPVNRLFAPGRYRVVYDASDLPSGMYVVKMSAADYTKIGKMMLLK